MFSDTLRIQTKSDFEWASRSWGAGFAVYAALSDSCKWHLRDALRTSAGCNKHFIQLDMHAEKDGKAQGMYR